MQQHHTAAAENVGTVHVTSEGDELLDLRAIGRALRRNWLLIVAISAVALLLAAIAYFSTKPTYFATAKLMVERVPDEALVPGNREQPVFPADSPTVDTVAAVLRSPDLLGRVVDRLNLVRNPEFNPALAEGADSATPADAAARDRAIRILASSLHVERDGASYAIDIHYGSPEPRTAAAVANAVMDTYLEGRREASTATTERSAQLLGERLNELRGEVLAAERAVAEYRARHRLFAASADSSITQQQLSVLDSELASARAAQAAASARRAAVRRRSAETIQESLNSGVVGGLRQQRAELGATAADLASRYGPRHPERIRVEQQLAEIDDQIRSEVVRVSASVTNEADVAQGRAASLAASIEQLQHRLAADNIAAVRLNELERNAESARAIYQAFLDNYRQALARQGTEPIDASAISAAQVPVMPSEPNPLMYLLMGLMAAGVLSGIAVLVAEARRGRVVA